MISGSVVLFLGICTLCDRLKQTVYLMIIMAGLFLAVFHTQLLNGFRIINNKMALALNQSMDLGFYYYVSVQMENSRRDSVLAVVFFSDCRDTFIIFKEISVDLVCFNRGDGVLCFDCGTI